MFQRIVPVFVLVMTASCAQAAKNVVVVVDDSGSMADRMREGTERMQAAKQALQTVLNNLPQESKVGILALNQGWIIPLEKLDRSKSTSRINRLKARGGTLLGENMKVAADALMALREDQVYGEYTLLVVTDGEANDPDYLAHVLPDIMTRGFNVDVIGVDMVSDHSLATRVHNYRRADDVSSLKTAIEESLAESDDSVAVGGESDFEVLEGLPQDVARSVITTLTTFENKPVGGSEYNPADYAFGPMNIPVPSTQSGSGKPFIGGLVFFMGIIFFAVATLSSLLRAARRA